ncbi:transcriptional regulator [Brevibacterium sp. FME37]|uniref:helix-turn-helix transcriptional regulator n=1 Tax=Brevibacterium sp. FME37 TaxID=2742607 RepID=UPI001867E345|nr:PAS domain-containing protein [Brevibacterium sp. FME37]
MTALNSDRYDQKVRETLELLAGISEPLARALGEGCEVVIHDLTNLDNSVYAIAGGVTGREVGAPPTNLLLQHVLSGAQGDVIGYPTSLPGGRTGRSSTIIIREPESGTPMAALCLNIDVTNVRLAHDMLGSLLATPPPVAETSEEPDTGEVFPHTVSELTAQIVAEVIASADVPVELMKKPHKLEVVAELDRRGVFQVKEAVAGVASALDVTRYTIYNYINELQGRAPEGQS